MRHATEWGDGYVVDSNGDIKPPSDFYDGDGTPMDAPDEKLFDIPVSVSDERFVHVGASAVSRIMERAPSDGRHPHTVEELIAERKRKSHLPEREDAYAALGGGIPAYRETELTRDERLEGCLEAYEDWHVDTKEAVERYGVVDVTPKELRAMKEEYFKQYSLHFYGFLHSIEATARLIKSYDGRTDIPMDQFLKDRYPGRSWEDLHAYQKRLGYLRDELEETGIPEVVRHELGIHDDNPQNEASHRALSRLTKFRHQPHRTLKHVQVVKGRSGLKVEAVE